MKRFFVFLLGFLGIGLAATTAFFSIYGISTLLIGKALAVIILFSFIEASKIALVSTFHQFSDRINWIYKSLMILLIVAMMAVTSVGVYGFLSSAYTVTSVELEKLSGKTELLDKKIEIKEEEKAVVYDQVDAKNKRMTTLVELRSSQETRLDSLYQRGWYTSAKQTEKIIAEANNDIKFISSEIDSLNSYAQTLNDSISAYELEKMELNSGAVQGEIGPLKYIANITGLPMDIVVNWLMLIFVFLADPVAVLLIIIMNKIIKMIRIDKQGEPVKTGESSREKKRKKWSWFKKKEKPTSKDFINKMSEKFREAVAEVPDEMFEKIMDKVDGQKDESADSQSMTASYSFDKDSYDDIKINNPFEFTTQTESDKFEQKEAVEEVADVSKYIGKIEHAPVQKIEVEVEPQKEIDVEVIDKIEPVEDGGEVEVISEEPVSSMPTDHDILSSLSQYKTIYLDLLDILYKKGAYKIGDRVPDYAEFLKSVKFLNLTLTEKTISDFFLICNLLNILDMSSKERPIFAKNYSDAKLILGMLKPKK